MGGQDQWSEAVGGEGQGQQDQWGDQWVKEEWDEKDWKGDGWSKVEEGAGAEANVETEKQ